MSVSLPDSGAGGVVDARGALGAGGGALGAGGALETGGSIGAGGGIVEMRFNGGESIDALRSGRTTVCSSSRCGRGARGVSRRRRGAGNEAGTRAAAESGGGGKVCTLRAGIKVVSS